MELLAACPTCDLLLVLSLMILVGLFIGRYAERLKLPSVSGYLLVGILFGFVLLWLYSDGLLDTFLFITKFALGFIAFSIGLELDFKRLWARRNEVIVVTMVQAVGAFILTSIGLWIFGMPLHIALILGSIAIATEPGPILFLTKRYKTKGDLTDTLVPLHGLEDAFAIIVFGVVLSYAVGVDQGLPMTMRNILEGPVFELVFSIGLGSIIGFGFRTIIRKLDYGDRDKDMVVFVSAFVAIMAAIALANRGMSLFGFSIHLSPVLLPMVVGIVFANTSSPLAKKETEHMLDTFSPPIIITFFTVVGAEMVFFLFGGSFTMTGLFIRFSIVYILFRLAGKLLGTYIGARTGKASTSVRRYLGLCLIPQAQAAIGLALYAQSMLSSTPYTDKLVLIVVIGTLVYELFGPIGLRHALLKCEDCYPLTEIERKR